MFGFLTSEISGAVRRNLTIYGLYGLVAVLLVCAFGYGLDALHTILTLRHGAVAASLSIAGGLLIAALAALGAASYVKNRRRPARPAAATALAAAPIALRLFGAKLNWRVGLLGVIVVAGAVLGRQIFSGEGADEAED